MRVRRAMRSFLLFRSYLNIPSPPAICVYRTDEPGFGLCNSPKRPRTQLHASNSRKIIANTGKACPVAVRFVTDNRLVEENR